MSAAEESRVSPIGIIAGGGMLPKALADRCMAEDRQVAVVALKGFAQDINNFIPHLRIELSLGQGARMVRFFRDNGVRDLVLIGSVRRPSFFDIRPDWWTLMKLGPTLLAGGLGDDGLLKTIRTFLEKQGFVLRGIQDYLPELLAGDGVLGAAAPIADDDVDIRRGLEAAHAIGKADIGQSVVVQNGMILGVEAIEGTDGLIRRCTSLKRQGPGPILVKAAKPGQDDVLDLPTIGPETVKQCLAAGFRGIVVEAGRTLIVDPERLIAQADPVGFFIVGRSVF